MPKPLLKLVKGGEMQVVDVVHAVKIEFAPPKWQKLDTRAV